jgi:hypothetical protein
MVQDMAERVENLDSLVGVWARRSIRWPDGREDTTTQVWWVQGRLYFADIRIPAGRPSFGKVRSLEACNSEQRAWLDRQEGFAGTLTAADGAWMWNREIDYQPRTGKRDIGRLVFTDLHRRMMIEEGVDEPYTEVWERIDDATSTSGEVFVMRSRSQTEAGILVAVGHHFILAVDSRDTGVEISLGARARQISKWIVGKSTCFWREGTPAFGDLTIDWKKRALIGSRAWEILEPSNGELDWIY